MTLHGSRIKTHTVASSLSGNSSVSLIEVMVKNERVTAQNMETRFQRNTTAPLRKTWLPTYGFPFKQQTK
jgi:hypothetical protein